jgi:hypothetical protein
MMMIVWLLMLLPAAAAAAAVVVDTLLIMTINIGIVTIMAIIHDWIMKMDDNKSSFCLLQFLLLLQSIAISVLLGLPIGAEKSRGTTERVFTFSWK